jgi:hypothetical protein
VGFLSAGDDAGLALFIRKELDGLVGAGSFEQKLDLSVLAHPKFEE